jgi:hypothetical protein
MKECGFLTPLKCLILAALLPAVANYGLSQSQIRNPKSEIRDWEPLGLSGGGGMFSPAISPADPNLMMLKCDKSAATLSCGVTPNVGLAFTRPMPM